MTYQITQVDWCEVTLVDEQGTISHVFRQNDGKWQCLRCLRYRCEHALFVKQANPTLPSPPPVRYGTDEDILTY